MRSVFRPSLALSVVAATLLSAAASNAWAQGNGLLGEYYDNQDFTGTKLTRTDATVNFNWVPGTDTLPGVMANTSFSVRWRGQVQALAAGDYTFTINSDDGSRLYLDGVLIISNNWVDGLVTKTSGLINLAAGSFHEITMEYYQGTGNATAQLSWTPPATAVQIIPQAQLYSGSVLAAPTINSPGGTVPPQSVTLDHVAGPGMTLYYTLDGSDPVPCGPSASALSVAAGTAININSYAQLRVRAWQAGSIASDPATMTFSPQFNPSSATVGTTVGQLYYRFFRTTANLIAIPDLEPLYPEQRGLVNSPTFTVGAAPAGLPARPVTTNFGYAFTGYVNIPSDNLYTFYTTGLTGSKLWVGGNLVVNNGVERSFTHEESGQIYLKAGLHTLKLHTWYRAQGTAAVTLSWQSPAIAKAAIPAANLRTDPMVATPTLSPVAPASFNPSQIVTISSTTPGAIIYYMEDGSFIPSGTGLSGVQVTLTSTTTLRAFASVSGMNPSDFVSGVYTRTGLVSGPKVSSVSAAATPTEILVVFDKPITSTTAGNTANYSINDGVGAPFTPTSATILSRPKEVVMGAWKMDALGGAAPEVTDTSGNNNHLTINGGVGAVVFEDAATTAPPYASYLNPAVPNAGTLKFDGIGGYLSVPNNTTLDSTFSSITISAWIKPADTTNPQRLINKWNTTLNQGWTLEINSSSGGGVLGNVRFRVRDTANVDADVASATGTLVQGVWHHVVGRLDKAKNQLTIWINGTQVASLNASTTLGNSNTTAAVGIGAYPSNAANFFSGNVDDVRIMTTALTDAEILALNAGADVVAPSVMLTLGTPLTGATNNTLTVSNVQDVFGNTITATDGTRPFKYFTVNDALGICSHERFTGIAGGSVAEGTRDAQFPNSPTFGSNPTGYMEVVATSPNVESFLYRMRGYFVPGPGQSGVWRFSIGSDDGGKLFLSTDADPANKRLIAFANVNTGGIHSYLTTTQRSASIPLVAGQKYYIEAYSKDNTGGDYLSVAAHFSASDFTNKTAADFSDTLSGVNLAPFIDPMAFTTQPINRVVSVGQSVSFTVAGFGTLSGTPNKYQWFQGATPVGTNSPTLSIASATLADEGNYTCVLSNVTGSVTSNVATLNVDDKAATPTISNLSRVAGLVAGAQGVTISGTNFVKDQTTVLFGGVAALNVSVALDGLSLTCDTPAHAAGAVNVQVNTPSSTPAVSVGGFVYFDPPTINVNGVNPPAGPLGGRSVTITGTNFSTVAGQTTVTFVGVGPGQNINVTSATTLTCDAPGPAAAGAVTVTVDTPGGQAVQNNAFTYMAAPTVGILSVTAGSTAAAPAVLITISGTDFLNGFTTVTFDNTSQNPVVIPAGSVTVTGSTSLTVTKPAHVAGSVDVIVDAPGGQAVKTNGFRYWNLPSIATVSPNGGPLLGGGPSITITGTNFSTVGSETTVTFGSVAQGQSPAGGVAVAVTEDSLTCTLPSHAAGSVDVIVTNPAGSFTLPNAFKYYAAPTVLTLSRTAGSTLGGGALMTITGTNFSPTAGQTNVYFGSIAQGQSQAGGVIVALTEDSLTCTLPTHAAGTVDVIVTSSGGSGSLPASFRYFGPPTITTISANAGPTAGTNTGPSQGSTNITISGTNFSTAAGETTVTIGGQTPTNLIVSGTGTLTCDTPAHDAGGVDVTIQTPGGNFTTTPANTGYIYMGPRITSVSPNNGPAAGGTPQVTIQGSGFVAGATVNFGIGTATNVNVAPGGLSLTCDPPSGTGTVNVTVTVAGNPAVFPNGYSYTALPTLGTISPNQGPIGGNQPVTITGTNFVAGQTNIIFDTTSVAANVVNSTTLTVQSPLHVAGTVNIGVSTFGSPAVTSANAYTYMDPPTILTVAPLKGSTAGGTLVTITGTNFSTIAGQTIVSFGGSTATANASSPTTLTVSTPAHLPAGSVNVIVSTFTPAQSSAPFSSFDYVNAASSVDMALTMTPSTSTPPVGTNVTFTITVNNTGAVAGTNVVVQDILPAGLSFVSATATSGSYSAATSLWNAGTINSGAGATLLLTAQVTTTATVVNTAEVIGCNPNSDVDSTFGNGIPGEDDQQSVSISALLTISTPGGPLAGATAGAPYYQMVSASGGVPNYTWSLTTAAATFPFKLDPATGVISGTAPLAAGNYAFTLMVSDSSGPPATASQSFSILVSAAPGGTPTVNAAPPPPAGTVGVAYSHTFTATGGTPPYTWSSTGGALPGGLLLNPSTGELAGTPTAAGTFGGLTINASGGSAPFSITINPNPVSILPLTLPNGSVGSIYEQPVQAVGGLGPTFTWTVSSGVAPPGLGFPAPPNGRVTLFKGTPTVNGTFNFTLKAQDDAVGGVFGTRAYTVTILPGSAPFAPSAPSAPPAGTLGQPYFLNLTGTGGTRPYTWVLVGGSLPTGVTLNGAAGNLSGTPLVAGVFQITLSAHDSAVPSASASQTLTITIAPAPVITTPSPLPDATDGVPYFAQFNVVGGVAPYTWFANGLSIGTLNLSSASGALSGVPTPAGLSTFDVQVTDANGAAVTMSNVSLTVVGTGPALAIHGSLPPATVGVPYSATITASGGSTPYTFSFVGAPPAWATLDQTLGSPVATLHGTPDGSVPTIQLQVTDVVPSSVSTNIAAVSSPLAIVQNTLPSGNTGSAYATALTTTGGLGLMRVWTLVSGSLPPGLSLNPAGLISGVAQANGSFIFRVQVSDTQGGIAQRQLSITIGASLPPGGSGGGGGGGGGGCGLLGAEVLLLWLWRRERRRKA